MDTGMPDGTTTLLGMVFDGLKWAWMAILGLLVWNGKRLVSRVDKIESMYVPSHTIEKAIDRLSSEIREQHKETHADIQSIHKRIDGMK